MWSASKGSVVSLAILTEARRTAAAGENRSIQLKLVPSGANTMPSTCTSKITVSALIQNKILKESVFLKQDLAEIHDFFYYPRDFHQIFRCIDHAATAIIFNNFRLAHREITARDIPATARKRSKAAPSWQANFSVESSPFRPRKIVQSTAQNCLMDMEMWYPNNSEPNPGAQHKLSPMRHRNLAGTDNQAPSPDQPRRYGKMVSSHPFTPSQESTP